MLLGMTQSSLVSALITYRYAVLFPLAFLEGPVLSVLIGFLVFGGYLALAPSFAILLFADFCRDTASYLVGKLWHPKFATSRLGRRLKGMDHLWHTHIVKAMILSKWAYGLSFPLLISAGLARVPMRKFILIALSVTVFQYAILISLGYYVGQSYQIVSHYLIDAQIFAAVGAVVFMLLIFSLSFLAKRKLPPEKT